MRLPHIFLILFLLFLCYLCLPHTFISQIRAQDEPSSGDVEGDSKNITSTICRHHLLHYDESSMESEHNLTIQGEVLTNYKANAPYLPWDEDCGFHFKAFACARAFGDVCRSTCERYVRSCWFRNGGNFNVNIFWRKKQYLKKLDYFCEQNSVPKGDPCVETKEYEKK